MSCPDEKLWSSQVCTARTQKECLPFCTKHCLEYWRRKLSSLGFLSSYEFKIDVLHTSDTFGVINVRKNYDRGTITIIEIRYEHPSPPAEFEATSQEEAAVQLCKLLQQWNEHTFQWT